MSRHTTLFTTDPVYRARQEIRNRLQRLGDEARTTAKCFEEADMGSESRMWNEVADQVADLVRGLESRNKEDLDAKVGRREALRKRPALSVWDRRPAVPTVGTEMNP